MVYPDDIDKTVCVSLCNGYFSADQMDQIADVNWCVNLPLHPNF